MSDDVAAPTSGVAPSAGQQVGGDAASHRSGALLRRFHPVVYLAAVVAVAPLFLDAQLLTVGVFAGIFALAALGLQLMMGLAGQANLGQAGFFAIGAYTSALLVTRYDVNALIAASVAVAVTVVAALVVGLPLLRLKGYYLALATFGFGIIVAVLANELPFLGHATGIFGVPKPVIAGITFTSPQSFFYLVWALVAVSVVLAGNLVSSRQGRALAAVHDSEVAAESLGVDTFRLRLQILLLCAALGSVAGSLYVHWVSVINPAAASFLLSIRFIVMAAVGGLLTVWGAVFGAVIIQGLGETLHVVVPRFVGGSSGEIQLIVFGAILAAVLVAMPGGVVPPASRILGRLIGGPRADDRRSTSVRGRGRSGHDSAELDVPATVDMDVDDLLHRETTTGTALLDVKRVSKSFGGVRAVNDVDLDVRAGEIVALIGPNGAGKTTLFNIISGVVTPTGGTVKVKGHSVAGFRPNRIAALGTARTFQNLELFSSMSVLDNVKVGRHLRSRAGILAGAAAVLTRAEERSIEEVALNLVRLVGLEDAAHVPASELPFGRQRLVEIARALASEPDLLLLDEPMAGLTAAERQHLSDLLSSLRAANLGVLIVEHDIDAVLALADRVAVLDNGTCIASATPEEVRTDPAVIDAYLGVDLDFADLRGGR